ncbi:MAG: SpoIIIAH-like family protein [Lachnospiraceae bacterium]|nr:SpoIIIAH-like family protein [Lachnospiraceae bacterium]
MKKIFRKNQLIITTLAVMIAVAGYLNYSGEQFGSKKEDAKAAEGKNVVEDQAGIMDTSDISQEDIYAKTQEVLAEDVLKQSSSDEASGDAVETIKDIEALPEVEEANADGEAGKEPSNPGTAVLASSSDVGAIAQARLTREQTRAKNKEVLLDIINNGALGEGQKEQAVQEMIDLTAVAEKEAAAEILLEAKGFADAVVSMQENSVDVVVNASELTDVQRAQIEDIVKRKTGVTGENIVITPVK